MKSCLGRGGPSSVLRLRQRNKQAQPFWETWVPLPTSVTQLELTESLEGCTHLHFVASCNQEAHAVDVSVELCGHFRMVQPNTTKGSGISDFCTDFLGALDSHYQDKEAGRPSSWVASHGWTGEPECSGKI